MRRMFDLVKQVEQAHHHVCLSQEFRSDLQWWASFLPLWNGKSILHPANPQHVVTADASGSWGCGAFGSNGCWFQLQWPQLPCGGAEWQASTVLIRPDNYAVVSSLSSGSAKDVTLMHLLRCLHFYLAQFDIRVVTRHIAGAENTAADALSRDNLEVFFQLNPQAKKHPSPGAADTSSPRLALANLEETLSGYLAQSIAPSTLRTYQSGQRRFLRFCTDSGRQPLPLSEHTLCLFVAHLASQGLVPQTIKSYLSAIRYFNVMVGHGDPFIPGAFPLLQYAVRGIKRAPRSPSRPRLPLTPSLLLSIKSHWEPRAKSSIL